jgi:hypothetical protein
LAKGIPVIGRAPDKKAKIINVDELGNLKVSQLESKLDGIENKLVTLEQKLTDGSQKVQLSGTMTERYGADVNSRPPADTVLAGTTFTVVDESGYFQTWISDGTKWVEV